MLRHPDTSRARASLRVTVLAHHRVRTDWAGGCVSVQRALVSPRGDACAEWTPGARIIRTTMNKLAPWLPILSIALLVWPPGAAAAPAAPSARTSPAATAAPVPSPAVQAPAPAQGPAPESIPVPEVARRADEVGRMLRDLDAMLVPDAFIEGIDKRFPMVVQRIAAQSQETDRQLGAEPSGAMLDALTSQWQAVRAEMGGYVNVLAQRATALEGALKRLETLQDTWTRTRFEAQASRAPAPVIGRINGVLTAVSATRTGTQDARAAILVSQDRYAQELTRCEAVLERIARTREEQAGRLLEPDSAPLWRAGEFTETARELPAQMSRAREADLALLRRFAGEQGWKFFVQAALFLGLLTVMYAARRRVRRWAGPDTSSVRAFERPLSAALVLALLATPWIYAPPLPRAFVALAEILALLPAVRLMRPLIDPSLVTWLYVLTGFFAADLVRHLASGAPILERLIFLLEMLSGVIALTGWLISRGWRSARSSPPAGPPRAVWVAVCAVLGAFAAAFVIGAAGYTKLAFVVGGRILGNGYLALVLYAGVRVADGLVAVALRARPFRYLGMVQRRRTLLEQRAHGVLRWVAIGAWVVLSLQYFGLWTVTVATVRSVLGAELHLGSVAISLGEILVFALTVAGAFVVSAILRFVLDEDVYPRLNLGRGLPYALSSLLHYFLLLAGFLLALAALGVDLTKITILAGALGVGIGFGLQNLVNNFVSGSLILFERKIQVGDAVQIGDTAGQVQQLGMRACTVRTWEGAEVIVPNATLMSDKVTNWTLSDRRRRIDLTVGVAYGTPPGKVIEVLLGVAKAHPQLLAEPEPTALFQAFGDSALLFVMYVWTDRFDLWARTRSELNVALYEALQAAGIAIPFPQRELHIRHE